MLTSNFIYINSIIGRNREELEATKKKYSENFTGEWSMAEQNFSSEPLDENGEDVKAEKVDTNKVAKDSLTLENPNSEDVLVRKDELLSTKTLCLCMFTATFRLSFYILTYQPHTPNLKI